MTRPGETTPSTPSDAVLTVPNLLTFFRLALTPLFLWVALGPEQMGAAFAIACVGFVSDLVDGKIARRYGQISKLGIALDPLSDRLALAAGAVVLVVHDLAPLWAVLLIVARDAALVLIGAPILKATGAPIPPVSRIGKIASFGVSLTFGLFVASAIPGARAPWESVQWSAWVAYVVSVPLYYAAATGYVRAGLGALAARRRAA